MEKMKGLKYEGDMVIALTSKKWADKLDWGYVSVYQKLSEPFMAQWADKLDWDCVSKYQKLSEPFMAQWADKLNWEYVSEYQKLSEPFMAQWADKLDWYRVSTYQKLSEPFMAQWADKLNKKFIKSSWAYKDEVFLKEAVVSTGLYECFDEYFVAWKGIRSDRYSKYNFQYQYLKGEEYESFADYSEDENSFGLSVWTKEKAEEYCPEMVVRCKVYYRDVARMVHENGKIRCTKIQILD